MNIKENLLLVWIFVVVAFSFLFTHFGGYLVFALGRAVALGILSLPVLAMCIAALLSVSFLP